MSVNKLGRGSPPKNIDESAKPKVAHTHQPVQAKPNALDDSFTKAIPFGRSTATKDDGLAAFGGRDLTLSTAEIPTALEHLDVTIARLGASAPMTAFVQTLATAQALQRAMAIAASPGPEALHNPLLDLALKASLAIDGSGTRTSAELKALASVASGTQACLRSLGQRSEALSAAIPRLQTTLIQTKNEDSARFAHFDAFSAQHAHLLASGDVAGFGLALSDGAFNKGATHSNIAFGPPSIVQALATLRDLCVLQPGDPAAADLLSKIQAHLHDAKIAKVDDNDLQPVTQWAQLCAKHFGLQSASDVAVAVPVERETDLRDAYQLASSLIASKLSPALASLNAYGCGKPEDAACFRHRLGEDVMKDDSIALAVLAQFGVADGPRQLLALRRGSDEAYQAVFATARDRTRRLSEARAEAGTPYAHEQGGRDQLFSLLAHYPLAAPAVFASLGFQHLQEFPPAENLDTAQWPASERELYDAFRSHQNAQVWKERAKVAGSVAALIGVGLLTGGAGWIVAASVGAASGVATGGKHIIDAQNKATEVQDAASLGLQSNAAVLDAEGNADAAWREAAVMVVFSTVGGAVAGKALARGVAPALGKLIVQEAALGFGSGALSAAASYRFSQADSDERMAIVMEGAIVGSVGGAAGAVGGAALGKAFIVVKGRLRPGAELQIRDAAGVSINDKAKSIDTAIGEILTDGGRRVKVIRAEALEIPVYKGRDAAGLHHLAKPPPVQAKPAVKLKPKPKPKPLQEPKPNAPAAKPAAPGVVLSDLKRLNFREVHALRERGFIVVEKAKAADGHPLYLVTKR